MHFILGAPAAKGQRALWSLACASARSSCARRATSSASTALLRSLASSPDCWALILIPLSGLSFLLEASSSSRAHSGLGGLATAAAASLSHCGSSSTNSRLMGESRPCKWWSGFIAHVNGPFNEPATLCCSLWSVATVAAWAEAASEVAASVVAATAVAAMAVALMARSRRPNWLSASHRSWTAARRRRPGGGETSACSAAAGAGRACGLMMSIGANGPPPHQTTS